MNSVYFASGRLDPAKDDPHCTRQGAAVVARFAYITAVDISIDDGPGINEREFVRQLVNHHGDEVVCVIPEPAKPENYRDDRIFYTHNHRRHHPYHYLRYHASTFKTVRRLVREHQLEVLAFRLDPAPITAWRCARWGKCKIAVKTLAEQVTVLSGFKHRLVNRVAEPMHRLVMKRIAGGDTVCIPYAELFAHQYQIPKERLIVVPNGANTEKFQTLDRQASRKEAKLTEFDFIVGYVGAIGQPIRHIESLIRGFAGLKTPGRAALVLVGAGKNTQAYEELAQELGVADRVLFLGKVPYSEVPAYMNSLDVAADMTMVTVDVAGRELPSSFSQKIPQYLACGVPVLAWDVPDNAFIGSAGIGALAEVGSVESVTAALQELADLDPQQRREMQTRCRDYVERELSISRLAERRVEYWRELANR
jgi:glycosyltransferase involved in cell wall biosynthesis